MDIAFVQCLTFVCGDIVCYLGGSLVSPTVQGFVSSQAVNLV